MRFASPDEFRDTPQKAVTLFGMSGVGKTRLASMLRRSKWFHYSVDYRIGTRYMGEHIVDNFKREAMRVPLLRDLLRSDSIYISSNITFENLEPLSTYLGKPGNRKRGGLSFEEYRRRQDRHRAAEIAALRDVPTFIGKAQDIYGYRHFVCDTGGSLCEVVDLDDPADPVIRALADNTLILYIRGSADHARTLVKRFQNAPKPMYYPPALLADWWQAFKTGHGIDRDDDVNPDAFAVWGFEQLIHHRMPLYERIAGHHGYVIEASEVAAVRNVAGFVDLVCRAIARA